MVIMQNYLFVAVILTLGKLSISPAPRELEEQQSSFSGTKHLTNKHNRYKDYRQKYGLIS